MEKFKNFLALGAAFFFLTFMPFFLTFAGAAFYKYVDKNGTVHFTDRYESIPQEYRDQVKTIREEPKPQAPASQLEGQEKMKEDELGAGERATQVQEAEKKRETEKIEARKKEAEEKKLKAIEAKEKQIDELQEQIEDKQKQKRSLRTNWMVNDRNTIIRLNEEIAVLEKQIKSIQGELGEEK